MAFFAYRYAVSGMTADHAAPFPRFSSVDFRDTVWLPTREFWSGRDPYDQVAYLQRHPYAQEFSLYAPVVLLIGTPLALLPFDLAVALWALVLVAGCLVIVKVGLWIARVDAHLTWVAFGAALLLITPVGNQPFSSGQFAIVSAAGACLALGARSERLQAVGTVLAIVKPQVGLPLLVVMVLSGRSRSALWGVVLAALGSAPAAIVLAARAGGVRDWVEVLLTNLRGSAASPYTAGGRADSTRIDLLGLSQRMGVDVNDTVALILVLAPLVIGAVLLVMMRARCHAVRACAARGAVLWWSAAVGVMVLVTPTELYGYLVAVPPLIACTALVVAHHRPWWCVPLTLALAVPFVHVHRLDVMVIGTQLDWLNSAAIVTACVVLPAAALIRPEPIPEVTPR